MADIVTYYISSDDEEESVRPELSADDSPLRSENSTNDATPIEMIIGANRTRNGPETERRRRIDKEAENQLLFGVVV